MCSVHVSKTMFSMLKISNLTIIYNILFITSEYIVAIYKLQIQSSLPTFRNFFFTHSAIINMIGRYS